MKIIRNLLNISIVTISYLSLFSCDPADNRLKIVNDSSMDIYYFYSCDSSLNDLNIFRRNLYKDYRDGRYLQSNQFIEKESFINVSERGFNAWIHYLDDCKSNKFHLYIFADSIVSKYSDYEIKYQKLYAKHFSFTLRELERNNWTIKFIR